MKVLELTAEQKKAFDSLKRAYKKCEALNILFYNNYGSLVALDKKYIKAIGDVKGNNTLSNRHVYLPNSMKIEHEWADDEHFLHPTALGFKVIEKENSEEE